MNAIPQDDKKRIDEAADVLGCDTTTKRQLLELLYQLGRNQGQQEGLVRAMWVIP